jgi:RimJ/RimL family protein N-acetyltransferase
MTSARVRISWATEHGKLVAVEPTAAEVAAHASALVRAYNDPHNAPLLGHESVLTEADVIEHYAELAHGFLLFRDGVLAGDGDVRGIADGAAEFAFLIASPGAQGKGLGTRFATMIHAFAFTELDLTRMYASIVPANVASRRVFEKLGYTLDGSAAARAYADEDDDVVMSIDRATFERGHAAALAQIVMR